MASPVIDSIVYPATVLPGSTHLITVNAHDPDSVNVGFQVNVQDAAGNPVVLNFSLSRQDELGYELVELTDTGVVIQATANPNVFQVTF